MTNERVIYDLERKRRVRIFAATNDSYSFIEEEFSEDPLEMCWIPQTHRRSQPICSSFEIAIREAYGRVAWLGAVPE